MTQQATSSGIDPEAKIQQQKKTMSRMETISMMSLTLAGAEFIFAIISSTGHTEVVGDLTPIRQLLIAGMAVTILVACSIICFLRALTLQAEVSALEREVRQNFSDPTRTLHN